MEKYGAEFLKWELWLWY